MFLSCYTWNYLPHEYWLLTHWPPGCMVVISKGSCVNTNYGLSSWEPLVKLLPQNTFGDKSTMVQVMVWCHQAPDVIKWKHFPRYWPFVQGINRSPVNSPHKDPWRGALMFSLICAWINGWLSQGWPILSPYAINRLLWVKSLPNSFVEMGFWEAWKYGIRNVIPQCQQRLPYWPDLLAPSYRLDLLGSFEICPESRESWYIAVGMWIMAQQFLYQKMNFKISVTWWLFCLSHIQCV